MIARCPRKWTSARASEASTISRPAPRSSPVSIERSVWEYFSGKAEQKGVALSELLTDVLKRDIEINEALK